MGNFILPQEQDPKFHEADFTGNKFLEFFSEIPSILSKGNAWLPRYL